MTKRPTNRLLTAIAARPLLLDGGVGTRLIRLGADRRFEDPALWNLSHPEAVRDVHARDVAAGSDAVLTNTFGANWTWLLGFYREADVAAINRRAVALAREAAGPDRFVLGSIGPTAWVNAREQADVLAESGVDGLVLETHRSARALDVLADLRPHLALPIVVGLFAFDEPIADAARRLVDAGADALGINCVRPDRALGWIGELSRAVSIPLLCKPAASHPDGPAVSAEDLAADVPAWLDRGVRLLGGCCGATEEHITALRSALDRATADGL